MKKIGLAIGILLTVIIGQGEAFSQSIYYDANKLSQYFISPADGKFSLPPATCNLAPEDQRCIDFRAYISVIKEYAPDGLKGLSGDLLISKLIDTNDANFNPFLAPLLKDPTAAAPSSFSGSSLFKTASEALHGSGSVNISTIADGAAQFLIERANQELTIAFFERFKKQVAENEELQTLFPTTSDFLDALEPLQFASMLNALREAFQEDLNNIVPNIDELLNTDKYQTIINSKPEFRSLFLGLASLEVIQELKQGAKPADILDELGSIENIEKSSKTLANVLKVTSLISSSIRDEGENNYVSYRDFRQNILENDVALKIYLGLLYEKSRSIILSINGNDIPLSDLVKEVTSAASYRSSDFVKGIEAITQQYSKIDDIITAIRVNNEAKVPYSKYAEAVEQILFSLKVGYDSFKDLSVNNIEISVFTDHPKFEASIDLISKLNFVYKSISDKNYSSAALNSVIAINELLELANAERRVDLESFTSLLNSSKSCTNQLSDISTKITSSPQHFSDIQALLNLGGYTGSDCDKLLADLKEHYLEKYFEPAKNIIDKDVLDKILLYGTFMANVAQADSPEEVKTAIEAAVLPVGSYRVKRDAKHTFSINSYIGLAFSNQKFSVLDTTTNQFSSATISAIDGLNSYGLNAPIGLEYSFGFKKRRLLFFKSFSVFVPLVDLGSVVTFRTQNSDDEKVDLPTLTLDNVLVFGGYGVLGFDKLPLSLGFGWQKGPQLREIGIQDATSFPILAERDWGFGVFLSADIPLFNLSVKPRN